MSLLVHNISYTKVGSGPHLCFLHGFCEDSSIWNYQIQHLQQDFTCIAIDLPGFGASREVPFKSIPEVARQIHDILIHEKATECVLLGHSLGGYLVGEYLTQYGDELVAAALIHSTLEADTEKKKANRRKSIDFISANGTSDFFRLFIKGLVALPHLGRLKGGLEEMILRNSKKSIIDGLSAMSARESKIQELVQFNKPVLFVMGEEDTHYETSSILSQAATCAVVQVSQIEDAGHLSMLEKPQENLAVLKEFLRFVNRTL